MRDCEGGDWVWDWGLGIREVEGKGDGRVMGGLEGGCKETT